MTIQKKWLGMHVHVFMVCLVNSLVFFSFFFFLYMPEQIYANAFVTYYMWGPNQTFMLFHYKNFELTKFCVFADTSPIVA